MLPLSELVSTAKIRISSGSAFRSGGPGRWARSVLSVMPYYRSEEIAHPMEKIGILTGGGDCPGLNAVIRAVVRRAHALGYDVLGIRNGWAGLIEGKVEPLTMFSVAGILPRGGTILGTSRTNPFKNPESLQKLKSNWQ